MRSDGVAVTAKQVASSNNTLHTLMGGKQKSWMTGTYPAAAAAPAIPQVARQIPRPAPPVLPSPAPSNESISPMATAMPMPEFPSAARNHVTDIQSQSFSVHAPSSIVESTPASTPKHANSRLVSPTNGEQAPPTLGLRPDLVVSSTGLPVAATVQLQQHQQHQHNDPDGAQQPQSSKRQKTNHTELDISNQLNAIDAFISNNGGTTALRQTVEFARFRMLRQACATQDQFYITLHKVFCLRTCSKYVFDGLFMFRDDLSSSEVGFRILSELIGANEEIRPVCLSFFASFPVPFQSLASEQIQESVETVSVFLRRFSEHWKYLSDQCSKRGYPPLVDELVHLFGLTSPILQRVVFTACRRNLQILDNTFGKAMEDVFTQDLDRYKMYNLESNPDNSSLANAPENLKRREMCIAQYKFIAHQCRLAMAAGRRASADSQRRDSVHNPARSNTLPSATSSRQISSPLFMDSTIYQSPQQSPQLQQSPFQGQFADQTSNYGFNTLQSPVQSTFQQLQSPSLDANMKWNGNSQQGSDRPQPPDDDFPQRARATSDIVRNSDIRTQGQLQQNAQSGSQNSQNMQPQFSNTQSQVVGGAYPSPLSGGQSGMTSPLYPPQNVTHNQRINEQQSGQVPVAPQPQNVSQWPQQISPTNPQTPIFQPQMVQQVQQIQPQLREQLHVLQQQPDNQPANTTMYPQMQHHPTEPQYVQQRIQQANPMQPPRPSHAHQHYAPQVEQQRQQHRQQLRQRQQQQQQRQRQQQQQSQQQTQQRLQQQMQQQVNSSMYSQIPHQPQQARLEDFGQTNPQSPHYVLQSAHEHNQQVLNYHNSHIPTQNNRSSSQHSTVVQPPPGRQNILPSSIIEQRRSESSAHGLSSLTKHTAAAHALEMANYQNTPPMKRNIIPPLGWMLAQQHPNPQSTALHQSFLTSPIMRAVGIKDLEVPSDFVARYYQTIVGFQVSPMALSRNNSMTRFDFTITPEIYNKILAGHIFVPGIDAAIGRHMRRGTIYLRLRCASFSKGTSVSEAEWTTAECVWPEGIFMEMNDFPLDLRRKAHHAKDLPLDINPFLRKPEADGFTNTIAISSLASEKINGARDYGIAVETIEILDHQQILEMVTTKQRISADKTLENIRASLSTAADDDDIAMVASDLTISLADPFMARIYDIPVRGSECLHRECFDLVTFLNTRPLRTRVNSELQPKKEYELCAVDVWKCPLCSKDARPSSLQLDEFFVRVRNTLESKGLLTCKTILINAEGEWRPKPEDESSNGKRSMSRAGIKDEGDDDRDDNYDAPKLATSKRTIEVIDLDDD